MFDQIQTSQTGGHPYSDTFPHGECSLGKITTFLFSFDFRRRLCATTSSESGFSDAQTDDDDNENDISIGTSSESKSESKNICDENEMSASTATIIQAVDVNDASHDVALNDTSQNDVSQNTTIPIFIPSLDYVSQAWKKTTK